MNEIDKLRQRLKNVGRNVTEYRMTVTEARALVAEFEELERKHLENLQTIAPPIIEPTTMIRILDGGTF